LTTPPDTNCPEFNDTTKLVGVEPPPWMESQLALVSVDVDTPMFNAAPLEVTVSAVVAGGRGWPFCKVKETDVGVTLSDAEPP
jgi:hypothetical protein